MSLLAIISCLVMLISVVTTCMAKAFLESCLPVFCKSIAISSLLMNSGTLERLEKERETLI